MEKLYSNNKIISNSNCRNIIKSKLNGTIEGEYWKIWSKQSLFLELL